MNVLLLKVYLIKDADSYCNIYYTEGLGNAPIVLLSSYHYVHYSYIKKRLEGDPKLTFNRRNKKKIQKRKYNDINYLIQKINLTNCSMRNKNLL